MDAITKAITEARVQTLVEVDILVRSLLPAQWTNVEYDYMESIRRAIANRIIEIQGAVNV